MRVIRYLFLAFIFCSFLPLEAQNDDMFKNKRERKRVWRKWNSKKDGYNPYLKKKKKNKPSMQGAKQDKRELKRQKRAYRRSNKHIKPKKD